MPGARVNDHCGRGTRTPATTLNRSRPGIGWPHLIVATRHDDDGAPDRLDRDGRRLKRSGVGHHTCLVPPSKSGWIRRRQPRLVQGHERQRHTPAGPVRGRPPRAVDIRPHVRRRCDCHDGLDTMIAGGDAQRSVRTKRAAQDRQPIHLRSHQLQRLGEIFQGNLPRPAMLTRPTEPPHRHSQCAMLREELRPIEVDRAARPSQDQHRGPTAARGPDQLQVLPRDRHSLHSVRLTKPRHRAAPDPLPKAHSTTPVRPITDRRVADRRPQ